MKHTGRITCPACGEQREETIPDDACVIRWTCPDCRHVVRPEPGQCCVFCSHSDRDCNLRAVEL